MSTVELTRLRTHLRSVTLIPLSALLISDELPLAIQHLNHLLTPASRLELTAGWQKILWIKNQLLLSLQKRFVTAWLKEILFSWDGFKVSSYTSWKSTFWEESWLFISISTRNSLFMFLSSVSCIWAASNFDVMEAEARLRQVSSSTSGFRI